MGHRTSIGVGFASILLVTGCATPSTTLQNASGQTVTCASSGWGVLGTPLALASHAECVEKMQASGFRAVDSRVAAPKPSEDAAKVSLSLPEGWERKPLTENMAKSGGSLYALNTKDDAGVLVSAVSSEGINDMMAYAAGRRAVQESLLLTPASSDIKVGEVNGRLALRFEVSGFVKSGIRVTYHYTIIQGDKQIGVVNVWTSAGTFEQKRASFESLANSLSGLS